MYPENNICTLRTIELSECRDGSPAVVAVTVTNPPGGASFPPLLRSTDAFPLLVIADAPL